MPFPNSDRSDPDTSERLQGIIQNVNLLERDVTVSTRIGTAVVDIPPGCPVYLHGERIKLRMLQPKDIVSIAFVRRDERLIAQKVEVQSGYLMLTSLQRQKTLAG